MAFPTIASVFNSQTSTAGTSHTMNVGSPSAGQLLIYFIRFAGAPGTVTFTGYTQFASDTSDASDDQTMLFYRLADGSEGVSDPLSTVNSIKMAAVGYRLSGTADPATQPPETSTVAVGTGANADSTTVTPTGGAKDYVFLAFLGMDSETATASMPAPWNNNINTNSGTGGAVATNCMVWGADNSVNAASMDPAAWTSSAPNAGWTAWTVAVHPPGAAPAAVLQPGFVNFQDPGVL